MENSIIYTYSIVHVSSVDFQGKTPYLVAVVEDIDKKRHSEFIEGYKEGMEISIGMPVYTYENPEGKTAYTLSKK